MLLVRLITDPFDLAAYSEHKPAQLLPFLVEQFPSWPETARIYRGSIAVENDVTPRDQQGLDDLHYADGVYYVVVYPGDPVTALIATVATLVLTAAVLLFLTPKIPAPGSNSTSSNNQLSGRTNKPRPTERIEDIFGSVISVPTLIATPLLIFNDNLEQEICTMVVGRGAYDIAEVKDGDTQIAQIAGTAVEFYNPYQSPNNAAPFLRIGAAITDLMRDVLRVNEVNGQVLRPPNANNVSGNGNIRFIYPDTIDCSGGINFTNYFAAGDQLTIAGSGFDQTTGEVQINESSRFTKAGEIQFQTYNPTALFNIGDYVTLQNAGYADTNNSSGITYIDLSGTYQISGVSSSKLTLASPASVNADWSKIDDYPADATSYRANVLTLPQETTGYNVDGTYQVVSVGTTSIVLSNPSIVNAAWNNLNGLPGHATEYVSPTLYTTGEHWVGPFLVDMPTANEVFVNFVALQGMYRITSKGKNQPAAVTVEIEVTPCNVNGSPTGPAMYYNTTLGGDGTDKSARGVTLATGTGFTGRFLVRARRDTLYDPNSLDTVVDEVKWRDLYGTVQANAEHFGDVTLVRTKTYATQGALNVKERRLNCRATRKVAIRNDDDTFGPSLAPSRNAADIICHMALDPYIGGRQLSELDVDQIYDTLSEVTAYFGIDDVGHFDYTFDQSNISFEEMVQTVAQNCFCTAYRQASKLRLYFEKATQDSTLLFNHRNKLPGSETRTVRFGNLDDNDGVELEYTSPIDGAKLTVFVPEDQSAVKPKKLTMDAVQSEAHAYLQAYRAYNKLRYQNTTTQFDALGEATQLVLTERIEVTDNTRPDVYDGYIVAQDGLNLSLSQPFTGDPGDYVIFIQTADGVEVAPVVRGADDYTVVLQEPLGHALTFDPNAAADIVYQITPTTGGRTSGFLLTEKGTYDKRSLQVQAINYDDRYYQHDLLYHP